VTENPPREADISRNQDDTGRELVFDTELDQAIRLDKQVKSLVDFPREVDNSFR
jgi:hypothetical protein